MFRFLAVGDIDKNQQQAVGKLVFFQNGRFQIDPQAGAVPADDGNFRGPRFIARQPRGQAPQQNRFGLRIEKSEIQRIWFRSSPRDQPVASSIFRLM